MTMEIGYRVIVAFVDGNAMAEILEPRSADGDEAERKRSWVVRVGPLVKEADISSQDWISYGNVFKQLEEFCEEHGIFPETLPQWH